MAQPRWTGTRLEHPGFDDHYGVDDGGFAEALHVFVDAARLVERFRQGGAFGVGDLGLGSGRNLLTLWSVFAAVAPPSARLVVHTFERDPLGWDHAYAALHAGWAAATEDVRSRLPGLLARMQQLRTTWPTPLPGVSELHTDDCRVRIVAWTGDAATTVPMVDAELDHWALDGFSPACNPQMWSEALLTAVAARTQVGGTVSTYTAAGQVRRALQAVGFEMVRVPGFGRKREMLVGTQTPDRPPGADAALRCPWPTRTSTGRIAIVGAGIAGCSLARELAETGREVTVFEAEGIGSGASGNPWGLLQPLPNLGGSPVGDWTTRGFVWTRAWAQRRGLPWLDVKVARYGERADYAERLRAELGWGTVLEDPRAIEDAPAGAILGITEAAMVQPRQWCEQLLDHPAIQLTTGHRVAQLRPGWWLDTAGPFDTVVLANSFAARSLVPELDLHPVRGQLVQLPASDASRLQTRALCGPVYLLPAQDGTHVLGATYHRHDLDPTQRVADTRWLWNTLTDALPGVGGWFVPPGADVAGRVSWRGVTPGRLPFVGPIDDPSAVGASLSPRKRSRPQFAPTALRPGLWVSAGHGSRGLVGAPFAAKVLTDAISGRTPPVPGNTLDAVHPSRVTIARLRR